jgi:hypothetical protein
MVNLHGWYDFRKGARMNPRLILFVLVAFGSPAWTAADAAPCPQEGADENDPVAFTLSLISAFEHFQRSRDTFARLQAARDPPAAFEVLNQAKEEAQCAGQYTERYSQSSNEGMKLTASEVQIVSSGIVASEEDFAALLQGQYAGDSHEELGEKAERVAKIGEDARTAWERLLRVANAGRDALVELGPDQKSKRLLLTNAQRVELSRRIKREFPRMRTKSQGGVDPVDASIDVLYTLLVDPRWKSRDQPF